MRGLTILGLTGHAGVGKNWIASNILTLHGFYDVALADAFKVEAIGAGGFTFSQVFHDKPPEVRTWLQRRGTEGFGPMLPGRAADPDIWVRTLEAWLALWSQRWGISRFVVTDVRFPNELAWIHRLGGKVIAVKGDRARPLTEEQRRHPSELEILRIQTFADGYVFNDQGMPFESIEAQVENHLRLWSLAR